MENTEAFKVCGYSMLMMMSSYFFSERNGKKKKSATNYQSFFLLTAESETNQIWIFGFVRKNIRI